MSPQEYYFKVRPLSKLLPKELEELGADTQGGGDRSVQPLSQLVGRSLA